MPDYTFIKIENSSPLIQNNLQANLLVRRGDQDIGGNAVNFTVGLGILAILYNKHKIQKQLSSQRTQTLQIIQAKADAKNTLKLELERLDSQHTGGALMLTAEQKSDIVDQYTESTDNSKLGVLFN